MDRFAVIRLVAMRRRTGAGLLKSLRWALGLRWRNAAPARHERAAVIRSCLPLVSMLLALGSAWGGLYLWLQRSLS